MENIEDITIKCADGVHLAATVYKPTTNVKSAIMIAPATGIKRRFYNAFATFLAENGYLTLTYDNRGIGGSKDGSINNVNASLENWGRLDMTAVLEELKQLAPNVDYHLVGHSAGGQLLGLMDNAKEIKSMFNFACSSGSIKNMNYPFKLNAGFFLNIFIPMSNLFLGKTNSQWVGMGEPLPKKVAAQWRKWCNGRGYIAVDLGKTITDHFYDDLTLPTIWLYATDDGIANYANVKDMIRVYSKINPEIITLNPKELGFKDIGHMKFFSSKKKVLWEYALEWFNKN